jgi:hypothetical protein
MSLCVGHRSVFAAVCTPCSLAVFSEKAINGPMGVVYLLDFDLSHAHLALPRTHHEEVEHFVSQETTPV